MWNTNFTMPTFVMIAIIVVTYLSKRRLPTRRYEVFDMVLVTEVATMIVAYLSTRVDGAPGTFPDALVWALNYLFFALFILRSYSFFAFACELVGLHDNKRFLLVARSLVVLDEVLLLVGGATGCVFSVQQGAFVQGVGYQFVNVQLVIWIVLAFVSVVAVRPPVEVRKGGLYAFLLILLCGAVLRMLQPGIVIMDLFCMFAILVIYLYYMNPDQYIDDGSTLFNPKGWLHFLDDSFSHGELCMVAFGVRDITGLEQLHGMERLTEAAAQVGAWMHDSWSRLQCFYLGQGMFVLASLKPFDQEGVLRSLRERFDEPWDSDAGAYYLRVNELVLDRGVRMQNRQQFRGVLYDAFRELMDGDTAEVFHIDQSAVTAYERRGEVELILKDALSKDGLEMFLQPIVNAATGEVEGAEALCRLPDGEGGLIYPDEFIGLAERDGNMSALGCQMFRKACAFLGREDVRGKLGWINVNVAPDQFSNPRLLSSFLRILGEFGLDSSRIHLEVTEESMIDRDLLHDSIEEFRSHGFVFSMDDFGSSYSNMIRLQQNKFSCVKIDCDFTWSYFQQPDALLPDIIAMCHDLGIQVVVEGIETAEMVEEVRRLGADYLQGYYYSKPIPAEKFRAKYLGAGEGASADAGALAGAR